MNKNRQQQIALVRKLIEGISKRFPKATKLTVGSRSFTPPELEKLLQGFLDKCGADAVAEANARQVKQALRAEEAATGPVVDALKTMLLGMFTNPLDLADFGVVPRKQPAPLTSEKLALAVERRRTTRKTRGTMGKRQRRDAETRAAQSNPVEPAVANVPPPKSNGAAAG
jgi:hypothetical protein